MPWGCVPRVQNPSPSPHHPRGHLEPGWQPQRAAEQARAVCRLAAGARVREPGQTPLFHLHPRKLTAAGGNHSIADGPACPQGRVLSPEAGQPLSRAAAPLSAGTEAPSPSQPWVLQGLRSAVRRTTCFLAVPAARNSPFLAGVEECKQSCHPWRNSCCSRRPGGCSPPHARRCGEPGWRAALQQRGESSCPAGPGIRPADSLGSCAAAFCCTVQDAAGRGLSPGTLWHSRRGAPVPWGSACTATGQGSCEGKRQRAQPHDCWGREMLPAPPQMQTEVLSRCRTLRTHGFPSSPRPPVL